MVLANPTAEKIYAKQETRNKKQLQHKSLVKKRNLSPYIFLSIFICIIGITQVLATDKLSTIGYEGKNLDLVNNNLQAEIAEIEVEIAKLLYIERIVSSALENGMIKVKPIQSYQSYIPLEVVSYIPEKYKLPPQGNDAYPQEVMDVNVTQNIFSDFIGFVKDAKNLILKFF
ncbi:MAG: hypothetical protein P8J51_00190 [Dehalococcoidia bacterium]|nr:hypothetical protein [Dehalococcoidia bacterium]